MTAIALLLALAAVPAARPRTTVTFQDGVGGYTGTRDVEIWAVAPHTILEGNPNMSSDLDNDGGESQILLRFEDIVGPKPGQIPRRSAVHSARLVVSAFDEGNTVYLHRMLVPWPRTATWASMVGGVTADGFEAARTRDGFTFGKIAANSSDIPFEATDTVQAWVSGATNHGWVFLNSGTNGWDFYASEFEDVKQRPKLVVEFTPPAPSTK